VKGKRIPERVIVTAVIRYASGESSIAVADSCGIGPSTVIAAVRRLGVPVRLRGPGSRAWPVRSIGWVIGDLSASSPLIHTTVEAAVDAYLEASGAAGENPPTITVVPR